MSDVLKVNNNLESALAKRGWTVEYGARDDLIRVFAGSSLHCGDGRNPERGPTLFGGLWGVMALKTGGSLRGAQEAKTLIRASLYRAGVHGDHHGELSCGFYNLWRDRKLEGVHGLDFSPKELPQILDGVDQITVPGEHVEERLVLNFVPDHTVTPNNKQFRVDVWLADDLGIDRKLLQEVSLQTVERLSETVRTVRIIK